MSESNAGSSPTIVLQFERIISTVEEGFSQPSLMMVVLDHSESKAV